ncbi:hypothetical protein J2W91_003536 [Paenibacillus amylolyticus]|uniref:Uncharacterized protein n=1 Tax=Paenibacillus amylolyticus TaxID=1451 RepID=A0AAP5H4F3_PAEAM|nr:hypothetical protein [Paenibacillus amylolyticus]MDR6725050.1 hypothetical protein [Paenibacillus amylolyticus]
MNKRQQQKIIPSLWIIAERQSEYRPYYVLYAIDWKRAGRLSWEGWDRLDDLLRFHVPIRHKIGSTRSTSQPCAKIAKKAIFLSLNEGQFETLEQMFYQPFSKTRWTKFIKQHCNLHKKVST